MLTLVIITLAFLGFCLSLYAFAVEQRKKNDPLYKPICNISARISCTKPFESQYAKIFGISNSILGLFFYPGLATVALLGYCILTLILTCIACLFSMYLGFVLATKIRSACLICISLYLVNASLLVVSVYQCLY